MNTNSQTSANLKKAVSAAYDTFKAACKALDTALDNRDVAHSAYTAYNTQFDRELYEAACADVRTAHKAALDARDAYKDARDAVANQTCDKLLNKG